jgi:hypothetical protein
MTERSSVVAEGPRNGVGQSPPGAEVGGDVKEPLLKCGTRILRSRKPARDLIEFRQPVAEGGNEQVLAGRESPVERGVGNTSAPSDVVQ